MFCRENSGEEQFRSNNRRIGGDRRGNYVAGKTFVLAEEIRAWRIERVRWRTERGLAGPFVMQIRFARHAKVSYADLGEKKGGKKGRLSLWSFLIYPKREQTARKVRWPRQEQEQGQQQYPLASARYPQLFREEEQRRMRGMPRKGDGRIEVGSFWSCDRQRGCQKWEPENGDEVEVKGIKREQGLGEAWRGTRWIVYYNRGIRC